MIRIGIELNNIVRNTNYQVMKYYKKDINPSFDETKISSNKCSIIEDIPFDSSDDRNQFVFIDYPYEIFGCARIMERNLAVIINNWLIDLNDDEKEDYKVSFFSQRENDLSIPSTYYFLSKIATRIRNMYFPKKEENLWDLYDIIITTDEKIVKNKPKGKVVVLIEKEDNIKSIKLSDYTYDTLSNALNDNKFISINGNSEQKNKGIFAKIKKIFKK